MKKLIVILSILCVASAKLSGAPFSFPGDKKPGDDKKSKTKREDTTKMVIQTPVDTEEELDESPDSVQNSFPSHDLYAVWDTDVAHPYKFSEVFKADSVVLELHGPGDNCFVMPYRGPLTSLFGWRKYRPHFGTDINLETGDTVVASFDGMVRVAKAYRGYGNCVIVRHNNGLETVYAHLSRILVQSGDPVSAGSILGLGGNTGRSYGSHLHFEIRYLGQALDSQDFIDYDKGELKTETFLLRKADVANKYDLRALHERHKRDMGMVRGKNGKYYIPQGSIYRVRNGDTLGAIARKSRTTVKSLCKKNRITPTTVLRIGQKLKI